MNDNFILILSIAIGLFGILMMVLAAHLINKTREIRDIEKNVNEQHVLEIRYQNTKLARYEKIILAYHLIFKDLIADHDSLNTQYRLNTLSAVVNTLDTSIHDAFSWDEFQVANPFTDDVIRDMGKILMKYYWYDPEVADFIKDLFQTIDEDSVNIDICQDKRKAHFRQLVEKLKKAGIQLNDDILQQGYLGVFSDTENTSKKERTPEELEEEMYRIIKEYDHYMKEHENDEEEDRSAVDSTESNTTDSNDFVQGKGNDS